MRSKARNPRRPQGAGKLPTRRFREGSRAGTRALTGFPLRTLAPAAETRAMGRIAGRPRGPPTIRGGHHGQTIQDGGAAQGGARRGDGEARRRGARGVRERQVGALPRGDVAVPPILRQQLAAHRDADAERYSRRQLHRLEAQVRPPGPQGQARHQDPCAGALPQGRGRGRRRGRRRAPGRLQAREHIRRQPDRGRAPPADRRAARRLGRALRAGDGRHRGGLPGAGRLRGDARGRQRLLLPRRAQDRHPPRHEPGADGQDGDPRARPQQDARLRRGHSARGPVRPRHPRGAGRVGGVRGGQPLRARHRRCPGLLLGLPQRRREPLRAKGPRKLFALRLPRWRRENSGPCGFRFPPCALREPRRPASRKARRRGVPGD